ncbi:MAG TPA: hypothetical protein PK299_11185 [Anaerolineales bacterium]|nr:hypothetical protein [Anaerolineales bacterium]
MMHRVFRLQTPIFSVLLLLGAWLWVGCAPSGIVRMSPQNQWGVVADADGLVILSRDGQQRRISDSYNSRYGVIFSQDGLTAVFVNTSGEIQRVAVTNGAPISYPNLTISPDRGVLLPLPSDQFLILDTTETEEVVAQVVAIENGQVLNRTEGIGQVFVSAGAVTAVQTSADESHWHAPDLPSGALKLVFQAIDAPEYLYLFAADADGFDMQAALPRLLSSDDLELLANRVADDPRSGLLTAEGRYLLLHTLADDVYQLWVLDLQSDTPARLLVADSAQPVEFLVAPDKPQVAYQTENGQVEISDLPSGLITQLPLGAEMQGWH